ncbi:MAG TPA: translocation/assembly module TamB domain-containing protein [Terriglobales bacterium]|nr:translocation/assembly module TamB domain-containing protein [Terriglobales bacterium]
MAEASQNSQAPVRQGRRRSKLWQGLLGVSLLGVAIWAAWFFTSSGFNNLVRIWLEHRVESTTGGKASIGALRWNLSRMEFEATDVVLRGLEAPSEKPFAHVDRIFARVQVRSFFHRQVDFENLVVDHPTIHIIVYPDGTTNQPLPKKKPESDRTPVEKLVDMAVGNLELKDAEFIFNQQTIPVAVDANDVTFHSTFDHNEKRYDAQLGLGKLEAHFDGWRPLPTAADVDFSLFRDHGVIKRMVVRSGKSSIEASGVINDFEHLAADLKYTARIDVREMAATARIRYLKTGTVDLQGTAKIAPRGSATNGSVKLTALNFDDGSVRVPGISGQSSYAVDRDRMIFKGISAKALGGAVTGDGEIRNWTVANAQAGAMNLRVAGVQLRDVADAASSKTLPLRELHFDGETSGTVKLTWRGSFQDSRADLALKMTPREAVPAGELPVSGDVRGTFLHRTQTMEIASAQLATPESTVSGQGSIGAYGLQVKVNARTSRATEFRSILRTLQAGNAYPVELNGPAAFNGTLSGNYSALSVAGHLEARDFTTILPMEAARASQPGQTGPVHWDSLVAEIRYSPSQVSFAHATLLRGSAQAVVDGNFGLTRGRFTDTSPMTVRGSLRNAEIADLQALLGYEYPVSGLLDANLQVAGTRNDLHGGGHVQLRETTLYGEPHCSVATNVLFKGQELQFPNFKASSPAGEVNGSGSYNLRTSAFQFSLSSGPLQLAQLRLLQEKRIHVEGTAQLEASGSGTAAAPSINARLHLRDLAFGGEQQGAIDLDATTRGEEMTLKGVSQFADADLQMNGTVHLRESFPAHLVFTFRNLDADPLFAAYIKQFHTTSHTLLAGRLEMTGPLRDPRRFVARGQVDSLVAGIENVKVANQGPILFSLENEVVGIDQLHLVGEGTDFTATGHVGLRGSNEIAARATGSVNMRILQSFSPEYTSSGLTTIDLNASGTVQHPRIRGRIQITNGSISYVDLPNGLSNINGTMFFSEDRLQVRSITAHTGGGDLNITGFITYSNGLTFNLVAQGKDIRLRYPPGVSASGDANLTLAGTPKNALLSGDVMVTRFGLNPRFDFASYLAKSRQVRPTVNPNSPLNGLRLDVHVVSTPELQLETSLAKVTGSIDVRLRGTAARPVLLGRVNIFEGDIVFNSTTYHLERGAITFNNPAQIQPVLDIEASARVRDYDITLGFHGPADRPSISYRSDPPLPTADIIALLALGRTRQESATAQMYNPQQQQLSESDENALLGQALNATVSSRVQRLFGVSRIKIDPQVGGAENNTNARLTIEQQVSNKITITYITNLSQSAQQIIQVEWNITRDLSLQGIRDQTGVLGFDVRIRQRKK